MSNTPTTVGLLAINNLNIVPQSVASTDEAEYGLVRDENGSRLAVLAAPGSPVFARFEGTTSEQHGKSLLLGPTNAQNVARLRELLPWLRPQLIALRTSAGMGDRLGLATPGHIRAVRAVGGSEKIAPVFPQQSIREMVRSGRTPQQVMDDAVWGVFAEGWRDGFGSDADHQKVPEDIDNCVAAGFTSFTIDPGEHVDNSAETVDMAGLRSAFEHLPWNQLEDNATALVRRYQSLDVEGYPILIDEVTLMRAAVKYGRAVAHVKMMYRHLVQAKRGQDHELEVSVDETEKPTSHAEHVYIAGELRRLGVKWVSLAPRYIGRFEKGVDFIGDLGAFETDFAVHAAIARHFGPYKLSLHSGSDKFSIYAITARQTDGLVHLKTAGTSYLEALRTIAVLEPPFFREIYAFAREHYEADRATYFVSAKLKRAPVLDNLEDADLPVLFEQFDARQILHVTFGSVMTARAENGGSRFNDHLMALLRANPDAYAANVEAHFRRHLEPFVQ
jgi:hypothetical protein